MFTMRLQGGAPICDQLERRLTELIICGEMSADEKLPPVREIANQLSINPNTVQKTYAKLEARGLIYSIPAKGSYVSTPDKFLDRVLSEAKREFSDAVNTAVRSGLKKRDLQEILDREIHDPENPSKEVV